MYFFCFGHFSFVLESTPLKKNMGKEPENKIEGEYDYGPLPDLNPIDSKIKIVRTLIEKGGIPVAMGWNAIKAVGLAKGTYELCPGDDVQVKTIAAGVAVATMLVGSPTFVGPVLFLVKKHGPKAWKSITSPKP